MNDKSPPIIDAQRYPQPFSLRLSKREREELKEMAAGEPIGRFIRDAIFKNGHRPCYSRKPTVADQKALAKLLGMLGHSRIANNINQLAKAANSGSLPINKDVIDGLNDAVHNIKWMRDTLITALGLKPLSTPEQENFNDPEG
ncbi:plasmid mobilization relaxosome protein MobC [uncultured Desulfuromonas sp.]|uniref:plasmid mobilization relaxosome protein MobC n=1 Tax=uncultured Desulfuromonas sp. TaxID=181013 RepID=UPI002AAA7915|nr:plasmid mobilization relaxosome protein MobC [uncultured Desulfuromonas sp.]